MAIIVEHKKNGTRYFVLGTGYGMYKAVQPSFFGGSLFPDEDEGVVQAVGVCDAEGNICFIDSNLFRVIEIDGVLIKDIKHKLSKGDKAKDDYKTCPACDSRIYADPIECPDCGLRLR